MEHQTFNKIARFNREIIVTEKIDGTNAQITITEDGEFLVGSRNRWITPESDNYGFAKWAMENKEELMKLGVGIHYGEWWGSGVNRGYSLTDGKRKFSLFNVSRWEDPEVRPKCCECVPVLWRGMFEKFNMDEVLGSLRILGSVAQPNFYKPEGIVIFHTAGNFLLKKTFEQDEGKEDRRNKPDGS